MSTTPTHPLAVTPQGDDLFLASTWHAAESRAGNPRVYDPTTDPAVLAALADVAPDLRAALDAHADAVTKADDLQDEGAVLAETYADSLTAWRPRPRRA